VPHGMGRRSAGEVDGQAVGSGASSVSLTRLGGHRAHSGKEQGMQRVGLARVAEEWGQGLGWVRRWPLIGGW
jgi:hypothetical protein